MKQVLKQVMAAMAGLAITVAARAESNFQLVPAPGTVSELTQIEIHIAGEWGLGSDRTGKFQLTGPEGVEIPGIRSGSTGSYYLITFANNATIETAGEYTFTIPDNYFSINGIDIPGETFTYTVVPAPQVPLPAYAINPAPGVYKTIDDGFSLTFNTEDAVTINSDGVEFIGPELDFDLYVAADSHMPVITIIPLDSDNQPAEVDKPGDYTLTIPARAIKVGDATNKTPLVFQYTITGNNVGNWQGKYTVEPADGSIVESLQHISITFTGAGVVKASDSATGDQFPHVYDADGGLASFCTVYCVANRLDITLTSVLTDGGTYTLRVPRQFVKVDGYNPTEDIVVTYTIPQDEDTIDYTYTADPADGAYIGASQAISITFAAEGLETVEYDVYAWGANAPRFTNDRGDYNPGLMAAVNGKTLMLTPQWPFEADGAYTLIIPKKYITLTDDKGRTVKNEEIKIEYNVTTTAIQSITGDNRTSETYTITGMPVSDGNKAAGVYVIDGKKTYIKK